MINVHEQNKKGEKQMFKKYILPIALVASLVLGNFSIQSADAASGHKIDQQQMQTQIERLLKQIPIEDVDQYLQLFNKLQKEFGQIRWEKIEYKKPSYHWHTQERPSEEPKLEQAEQEESQVEQPKPEQPKVEQPKEEKPQANPVPQQPVTPEQPKEEPKTEQVSQLSEFEQQVVELTNVERAKAGLAPLKADAELSRVAREKSRDMAGSGYFDHNSPTYGSPFDMMRAYGISYRTAGENIAKGQRTPAEVVNAWMNSQGHRENIMNPNFTHIGVGFVENGNHWTQMFIGK